MVWLLSCLCGASQLLEPSIQSSHTSYLSHWISRPHPPIPVGSPYLLLPNTSHAMLYRFGDCAHLPARFIIFAQLAKLCIFLIIILVFPSLLIFGTSNITQTVSDSIQHLPEWCFRLCGCWSCLFNIPHIFLRLHNRWLYVLNSLSCHCGLSSHIILDPVLFFFITYKEHFPSCPRRELLFDRTLRNTPNTLTLPGPKPLLPLFTWWRRREDRFVVLPYLPAGSG